MRLHDSLRQTIKLDCARLASSYELMSFIDAGALWHYDML